MKPTKILFYLVIIIAIPIIISVWRGDGDAGDLYIEEIITHRADKENFMKKSEDSPFIKQNTPFNGLRYFDPSADFVINARFEKLTNPEKVTLQTSDGKEKTYLKYATATFRRDNETQQLLLLKPVDMEDYLFVPFTDATSASATYGGGRYLEVEEPTRSKTVTLDFNKAYNPYCAYVDGYSCPFPPKENHLSLAIEAGEKDYVPLKN